MPVRVMLIDDDPGFAALLEEMFAPENRVLVLTHAPSLKAAGEWLATGSFDVVLLDLSLPDSFGLETVISARRDWPNLPVVVLTGNDDDTVAVEAVQLGAQDYLVKGRDTTRSHVLRTIRYAIERHTLLAQVQSLSLVDALTGLYNRRGFATLAEHHLSVANRAGRQALLFFFDLDGLKPINDRLGHAAGDAALKEAGAVLAEAFRSTDIVARLGGDEFAALALESSREHEQRIVERLDERLAARNAEPNRAFRLSISAGIIHHDPASPKPLDELLAEADARMYADKTRRRAARVQAVESSALDG